MPVHEECTITCPACGHDGSLDEWTIFGDWFMCNKCTTSLRRVRGTEKRVVFVGPYAFSLPGKVTIEVEAPNERD